MHQIVCEFGKRVLKYTLNQPPALIHAHDWVTFDAALISAKAIAVPWVAHFHSTEDDRKQDASEPFSKAIEQRAVHTATSLITPSAITARKLLVLYRANPRRVNIVPNSFSDGEDCTIDAARFDAKLVLFLGRLTAQKGVLTFCKIAEKVRKYTPEVSFEAIGAGEQSKLFKRYNVYWSGPLPWKERARGFRAASLLLVPSRDEPFGMVILEAMQHGVPVVYPEDAGAAEVLRSGIKVNRGEMVSTMTNSVLRLTRSVSAWKRIADAQRLEIASYLNRRYESRIIEVWANAISRPRLAAPSAFY